MQSFNSYLAQGIGSLPSSLVSVILILISILTVTVALERGYILFRANITLDPEQGRELIRLGYSDTMERRDEMLQFLQRRDNSPPVLVAQPADAG